MIRSLKNVRSRNSSPVIGIELAVDNASSFGILPELSEQLQYKLRHELYIDCECAFEATVAEQGGVMRSCINIHLRLGDINISTDKLEDYKRKLQTAAIKCAESLDVRIHLVEDGNGTVALVPEKNIAFFRKQNRMGNPSANSGISSAPLQYFMTFSGDKVDIREVIDLLKIYKNSGISLTLIPSEWSQSEKAVISRAASETKAISEYRNAYSKLLEGTRSYQYILAVWGRVKEELLGFYEVSGVSFFPIKLSGEDELQIYYELILDPWELNTRLNKYRIDKTLGRIAFSVSKDELSLFLPELPSDIETLAQGDDPISDETYESHTDRPVSFTESVVQPDPDKISDLLSTISTMGASVSSLSETVRELGSRNALSEVLRRMDDIEQQLEDLTISGYNKDTRSAIELSSKLQHIRCAIVSDVAKEIRESAKNTESKLSTHIDSSTESIGHSIDATRESINKNIDETAARFSEQLDRFFDRLPEHPSPEDIQTASSQAGISFELTPKDLEMLGFESEQEMLNNGLSESMLEALKTAIGFYKLIPSIDESRFNNYTPFVIMTGYLYELMAIEFIEPIDVYARAFLNNSSSTSSRSANDDQKLSRFDENKDCRRARLYAECVVFDRLDNTLLKYVNGRKRLAYFSWSVWFALFRSTRLSRNYIHGSDNGDMSKEHATAFFDCFFKNSIDTKDIFIIMNNNRAPDDIAFKVENAHSNVSFTLSIFRFLLLLRNASWDADSAET